jgi:hypothetical protein
MATPTNLPATQTVGGNATSTWANDIRGAFRVLQVINATSSTAWSNSTSTYSDITGITATITPQATGNKVLVIVNIQGAAKTNNTNLDIRLRRGTTTIQNSLGNFGTGSNLNQNGGITLVWLDSPATTAARTYTVQGASSANIASVSAQLLSASDSSITLFEISA